MVGHRGAGASGHRDGDSKRMLQSNICSMSSLQGVAVWHAMRVYILIMVHEWNEKKRKRPRDARDTQRHKNNA